MTTVNIAYNPADVFDAPCNIYFGITPPPSAVPPVQGTNTLVLDAYGQPTAGSTGQIATVSVGATGSGGTGYSVGETLTLVQSGGVAGMVRVATVSAGAVTAVILIHAGQGYSAANNLVTTGGGCTGATINVLTITAGFHIGLSEGPASFTTTPKFNQIKADQFSAPVDAAFVSAGTEIDIVVKEMIYKKLQQFFSGLFSATFYNLAAGSTNPARDFVQIGSSPSSLARMATMLLVAPRRDVPNKFVYAMGYRCYMASALAFSIGRKKENEFKLKFKCLADTTRVQGDMTGIVVRGT